MKISSLGELKATAERLKGTWFNRLSRSVVGVGFETACAISSALFAGGTIACFLKGPGLVIAICELPADGRDWAALVRVNTNMAVGLGLVASTTFVGSLLLAGFGGYLAAMRRERKLFFDLCDAIAKLKDPNDKDGGSPPARSDPPDCPPS